MPSSAEGRATVRIGLVGLGHTGCAAWRRLFELGFRRFHLADNPALVQAALDRSPSLGDAEVALHPGPDVGLGWARGWLARCAVCLLACDVTHPGVVLGVNAACLGLGVPLLPGLVLGNLAHLGPRVQPGAGLCLRCLDLRVRAIQGRTLFTAESADARLPERRLPELRLPELLGARLAEEADHWLAEGGKRLGAAGTFLHLTADGTATRHPVLGTRHCPDCRRDGPYPPYRFARRLDREARGSGDAELVLRLADQLVSPLTGPIARVRPQPPTPADPRGIHLWTATGAEPAVPPRGVRIVEGGGSSLSPDAARAAALAETLERMSLQEPDARHLFMASCEEIGEAAIDPARWDLFDDATLRQPGFPFPPRSRKRPIGWVWGYSLSQDRPVAVPADRVFLDDPPVAGNDRTDFPVYSGFALSTSLAEAAYRGLLEVLERDAFMIAWSNRLPLARLELGDEPESAVVELEQTFVDAGIEVRCFGAAFDLGATFVLAMGRSPRLGDPAVTVAAAADLEPARACRRALEELAASRVYVRSEMYRADRLPDNEPHQVLTMADHGLLYARRDMQDALDFWWRSSPSAAVEELVPAGPAASTSWARLDRLVAAIGAAGLEAAFVELTPPELAELGLVVVKSLVPGTYPLHFDSRWPHLDGERLRRVPVELGLLERPRSFDELQRGPHPFP